MDAIFIFLGSVNVSPLEITEELAIVQKSSDR
jgi:hypothetical protein